MDRAGPLDRIQKTEKIENQNTKKWPDERIIRKPEDQILQHDWILNISVKYNSKYSLFKCNLKGGVETGSMYVQYVKSFLVISANVPCTYYVQPLNSLKRYVHIPLGKFYVKIINLSNLEAV